MNALNRRPVAIAAEAESDTMPGTADIRDQAGHIRRSGILGKSPTLIALFDFLVERTLVNDIPKEVEVAQAVFSKHDLDIAQDASVRVYVHRLRRKLEAYYADQETGPRLMIPNGDYRLALVPQTQDQPSLPDKRRQAWPKGLLIAGSILLILNLLAWLAIYNRAPSDGLSGVRASAFWAPVVGSPRPTLIVVGDFYIFGQSDDGMRIDRLVREFPVNSRDDLDMMIMERPALAGHYIDLNLHYLPTGTARALNEILPVIGNRQRGAVPPHVITMSELTPAALRTNDIVYVGYLSGLGLLRDAVFTSSRFRVGSSYDELIDRRTGRHFEADAAVAAGGRAPGLDYAYLASFSGPAGNHITVIAGTRDSALHQAAEIVASGKALDELEKRSATRSAFEALYRVDGLGDQNFNGTLELASPRGGMKFGDQGSALSPFPDTVDPTLREK